MYNNGELNGFGWIVTDEITTYTFVKATNTSFKVNTLIYLHIKTWLLLKRVSMVSLYNP
jgi:hypothetical protein